MKKSIDIINRLLIDWKEKNPRKQLLIQEKTGIDQSQVSKILSGKSRRISNNVIKVCKYAKIDIDSDDKLKVSEPLMSAVLNAWDGSKESELLIIDILNNIGRLSTRSFSYD